MELRAESYFLQYYATNILSLYRCIQPNKASQISIETAETHMKVTCQSLAKSHSVAILSKLLYASCIPKYLDQKYVYY